MDGQTRREQILKMLAESEQPLSGSALAQQLGVSRQIIVSDIALLRAANRDIMATARGYLLYSPPVPRCSRCFMVSHTDEQMEDELNTIVDLGGRVLDVLIPHPIYGTIRADLVLSCRQDVAAFMQRLHTCHTKPLCTLTDGVHYHTVEAADEEILDSIEKALFSKKYLLTP